MMAEQHGIKIVASIASAAMVLLFGCAESPDACPRNLAGEVHPTDFSAAFTDLETEETTISMRIESVSVECIPYRSAGAGSASDDDQAPLRVRIAVTTDVTYDIQDMEWFTGRTIRPRGALVFEAVSAGGVVLAESFEGFQLRETGRRASVSTTFDSLEPEVALRVSRVVVRRDYGR